MTTFILKIILVVSIVCGNVAVIFIDGEKLTEIYTLFRMFSMMAVPIAAFLLVEGFHNTKNRKKYFLRIFITGLVAEIPFLVSSSVGLQRIADGIKRHVDAEGKLTADNLNELLKVSDTTRQYYQDLYFVTGRYAIDGLLTLAVAFLMIVMIDKLREKYFGIKQLAFYSLSTLVILGALAICVVLPFENPMEIIFFVLVFYYLRGNKPSTAIMTLLMVLCFYTRYGIMMASGTVLAVLLIQTYNGKQGSAKYKYVFYAVYPLQFLILFGIRYYIT